MKKVLLAAAALAVTMPVAANAAIIVTSVAATNPYTGPTPTYTFETATPVSGGTIRSTEVPNSSGRPYGSTGNYLSVGPADGTPATLNLSSFSDIGSISLLWGSIDQLNVLELLDAANNVIFSIDGFTLRSLNPIPSTTPGAPAIGDVNRVATFTFTDAATQAAVSAVRFRSSGNSFEIDNVAVRAVPEPATWLMMILGFFGLSFAIRRRGATAAPRVRFA